MKILRKILIIVLLLIIVATAFIIVFHIMKETNNSAKKKPYIKNMNIIETSIAALDINKLNSPRWYKNIKTVKNSGSYYVLVNKNNILPKTYMPTDLVYVEGQYLRKLAYTYYKKLRSALNKKGMSLYAVSGFRSYDAQKKNYERIKKIYGASYAEKYVARAGHSEHQTGLVMDVGRIYNRELGDFDNSKQYKFIKANAYKYGFIIRYQSENKTQTGYYPESWHLRFVGVAIAKLMHDNKLKSLEEYIFYYKPKYFN